MSIPIGSYIQKLPESLKSVSERRYAWSFIGGASKVSRPDMVRAMSSIQPHFCYSSSHVGGVTFYERDANGKRVLPLSEFFNILGDSVFVPAPMGNASMESCRPYDALDTGGIPIVEKRLTLDYYKGLLGDHPLPTVSSWSEGRQLASKLLNDPARLSDLQQRCLQWWAGYQSNLIASIGSFLEERSNASDDLVPLRSSLPKMPYWQYFELLRHHNASAFGRRISLQLTRLVQQKKWRIATRRGAIVNK